MLDFHFLKKVVVDSGQYRSMQRLSFGTNFYSAYDKALGLQMEVASLFGGFAGVTVSVQRVSIRSRFGKH